MIKHLLSLAAVAALSAGFGASAETVDILDTFGSSGWDSSYDAETQTITYDEDWRGRGWWLGEADYSDYDQVVVEIEPVEFAMRIVCEYVEGTKETNNSVDIPAGESKGVLVFNTELKNKVSQIYLQSTKAGTVVLKAAYLENGVEVDNSLIWEGSYEINGWNSGAEFSSSAVKAGEILCLTFEEAGADNGQVLLKASDWSNLLGASKITPADMAQKEVLLGVTEQMISSCGGKIFFQGDGGSKLVKIVKTGETFDPTGVLALCSHAAGGTSIYATVPEGEGYITVTFAEAGFEYAMLCNSGWNDFGLECSKSEDGLSYTYTLTPDAITAINDKKEMVVNTDGKVQKVVYSKTSGVEEAIAAGENAPVNVYNFAGKIVRAGVNPANAVEGFAPGLYIVGKKKVIVR